MVNLCCLLIIYKRRTIDTIPKNLKEPVIAELLKMGYDVNGDPILKKETKDVVG